MRFVTWLTSVLIALVLIACGGGGTGTTSNDTNTNTNDQTVSTLATAAQLTASFAPETQVASLSWKDTLPQGTQYAVQSQSTGGSSIRPARPSLNAHVAGHARQESDR